MINEKTYAIPLKSFHEAKYGRLKEPFLMTLRLSLPQLPRGAEGVDFAEHVYDRKSYATTPNVILTGRSMIVESKDNGATWELIRIPEVEDRRLYNCFTTDDGNHIVQSLPEQNINAKKTNPDRVVVFLFDKDWRLISVDESATTNWHGRASIDQSGATIMFAEYHNNSYKYTYTSSKEEYEKWKHLVKPNRVFRSRDGGRTWKVVFELSPEVIRHFHTLQADPFLPKTWWLSSGDLGIESRVWCSSDDGDSWVDVTPADGTKLASGAYAQSAFRYTDLVINQDSLIWGTDDIMGSSNRIDLELPQEMRTGSRIYRAKKSNPLQLEELGYIGHPVRSIVDVGPAYLFLTEVNIGYYRLTPQVVALFKDSMDKPVEVARIDHFENKKTSFTFSRASKAAYNGRFFSFRNRYDVFNDVYPRVLQWDVGFSD